MAPASRSTIPSTFGLNWYASWKGLQQISKAQVFHLTAMATKCVQNVKSWLLILSQLSTRMHHRPFSREFQILIRMQPDLSISTDLVWLCKFNKTQFSIERNKIMCVSKSNRFTSIFVGVMLPLVIDSLHTAQSSTAAAEKEIKSTSNGGGKDGRRQVTTNQVQHLYPSHLPKTQCGHRGLLHHTHCETVSLTRGLRLKLNQALKR